MIWINEEEDVKWEEDKAKTGWVRHGCRVMNRVSSIKCFECKDVS